LDVLTNIYTHSFTRTLTANSIASMSAADPEEGAVLIDGVDIKRFLVAVATVPDRRRLAEYFPPQ
jgi:hypothetical protein